MILSLARSVFALAVLAAPASAGPEHVAIDGPAGVSLQAELYRPGGAGPYPAVVALHGCGGLYDRAGVLNRRHSDWGERLSTAGFLVVLPDSFGSRGLSSQCRSGAREIRPGRERKADAFAAKAWLQARPDVKPGAVSLLGWSNGGSTVLYTAAAGAPGASGGPDFARAVAFYPGCRVPVEHGWRDRVPLLILVGQDDDWTGAGPCQDLAESAARRGEAVSIVVYPGAYHDFDHPNLPVRERGGLAYTVDGNGAAHVGTNPAARADALRRVPAFLAH